MDHQPTRSITITSVASSSSSSLSSSSSADTDINENYDTHRHHDQEQHHQQHVDHHMATTTATTTTTTSTTTATELNGSSTAASTITIPTATATATPQATPDHHHQPAYNQVDATMVNPSQLNAQQIQPRYQYRSRYSHQQHALRQSNYNNAAANDQIYTPDRQNNMPMSLHALFQPLPPQNDHNWDPSFQNSPSPSLPTRNRLSISSPFNSIVPPPLSARVSNQKSRQQNDVKGKLDREDTDDSDSDIDQATLNRVPPPLSVNRTPTITSSNVNSDPRSAEAAATATTASENFGPFFSSLTTTTLFNQLEGQSDETRSTTIVHDNNNNNVDNTNENSKPALKKTKSKKKKHKHNHHYEHHNHSSPHQHNLVHHHAHFQHRFQSNDDPHPYHHENHNQQRTHPSPSPSLTLSRCPSFPSSGSTVGVTTRNNEDSMEDPPHDTPTKFW
jgi:hypothetical protein